MAQKLRVGLASLVHDHTWGELNHWLAHPDVEVVAAGESNPRLQERAKSAGIPKVYSSWQEMIGSEKLDIVQAGSNNKECPDVTEAAMKAGAHVVSEKPMAATYAGAVRMMEAAKKSGKMLMINWPNVWDPIFQDWERRLLAGEIGRITHLKRRNAHNGPKEIGCDPSFVEWLYDAELNGAGALMDYCCYGADIAARFLGRPEAVTGFRGVLAKDYQLPDDNAILLMKYPQAIASTEASWTEIAYPDLPNTVAFGTEGALYIAGQYVVLAKPGEPIQKLSAPALEYPHRNAAEYFVHCLKNGETITGFCSPEVSLIAQEILEAGLRSSDTGMHVNLPL